MAKLPGDANSATNQWFINLGDNSANLDVQNGGFTVFGQVIGNGMDVINAINVVPTFNFSSPFESIPLRDYTAQNAADDVEITDRHLVIVSAIVVLNGAADTAAGLSPVANTLINQTPTSPPAASSGDSGGGGATGLVSLLLLGLLNVYRRRRWALDLQ